MLSCGSRISTENRQQILLQNGCHIFCQCQSAHMGPNIPVPPGTRPALPTAQDPIPAPGAISPHPSEAIGHVSSPVTALSCLAMGYAESGPPVGQSPIPIPKEVPDAPGWGCCGAPWPALLLSGSFCPSAAAQWCAERMGGIQAAMNNELATKEG